MDTYSRSRARGRSRSPRREARKEAALVTPKDRGSASDSADESPVSRYLIHTGTGGGRFLPHTSGLMKTVQYLISLPGTSHHGWASPTAADVASHAATDTRPKRCPAAPPSTPPLPSAQEPGRSSGRLPLHWRQACWETSCAAIATQKGMTTVQRKQAAKRLAQDNPVRQRTQTSNPADSPSFGTTEC